MLTGIVTPTGTLSSISTGILSIITPVDFPDYGLLAVIALILLLSVREVVSVSTKWSKSLECTFNMAIIPLLVAFVAIVVFKLAEMK
ncbi:hypothetical protein V7O62_13545 [Methanolobus sp. ZRKC2]|uniref:hypothetical protein n=1 Tax=Methanolobus sp. ZRKC2 TaxID=3125783 RepID=UPI0032568F21